MTRYQEILYHILTKEYKLVVARTAEAVENVAAYMGLEACEFDSVEDAAYQLWEHEGIGEAMDGRAFASYVDQILLGCGHVDYEDKFVLYYIIGE